MKRLALAISSVLLLCGTLVALPQYVEARSGCCSHHGGVCGCGCCDGSPLSATCAPYYPWCNGGGTAATAKPSCPANATYSGGSCYCNTGYATFNGVCVKIPANAHVAGNGTDAWVCNYGYEEAGSSCVKVQPKAAAPVVQQSSVQASELSVSSSSQQGQAHQFTEEELVEKAKLFASLLEGQNKKTDDSSMGGYLFWIVVLGGGYVYWKKKHRKK